VALLKLSLKEKKRRAYIGIDALIPMFKYFEN
jgi:hypothetical protein